MSTKSTACYILHTRPFKETSLILNLFSQNYGRFGLLAKGVKRKNAQAQRAILQPFNLLNVDYVGRGELKILTDVELTEKLSVAETSSLSNRALACGYYLNELLLRSLQEWQEFELLFEVYDKSIKQLQSSDEFPPILRNFEVALLGELGVAPEWHIDIHGDPIGSERYYHFNPEHGFEQVKKFHKENLIGDVENRFGGDSGFRGDAILSLGNGIYKPETHKTCQKITQLMLREIIGDRPLESRKLWL